MTTYSESNADKLSIIKIKILIALLFIILTMVLLTIGSFYLLYINNIIYTVIFTILTLFSIPVVVITSTMYIAVEKGDIKKLKELNSIGWAVFTLIFVNIISGILLLITYKPIKELQAGGIGVSQFSFLSSENLDRMIKLKSLMDSGVISKEEFETQKNAIFHSQ